MDWNQKFGDNFFSSNAPQLNLNEFLRRGGEKKLIPIGKLLIILSDLNISQDLLFLLLWRANSPGFEGGIPFLRIR
ncbi:hypothetical protein Peur_005620 [Populus x canadensis]